MQNTLKLVSRARVTSSVLTVPRLCLPPSTLAHPLLAPCPSRLLPLVPSLQQQVGRFSCGECPSSSSSKEKKDSSSEKKDEKGGQCSEENGERGGSEGKEGQYGSVKGKGSTKQKGSQCSEVKGKKDGSKVKGSQCSEIKGKEKKTDENPSSVGSCCGAFDTAKNVAKATTIICDDDGHQTTESSCTSSSSSSSSSESCTSSSESECTDTSESSDDDKPVNKQCPAEPLDPDVGDKFSKAATEMCACIQSALAQNKGGKKGGDSGKSLPKDNHGRPPSCGSLPKKDSKPKVSEHVRCCQVESSKTAPLGSGASSCKLKMEAAENNKNQESKDEDCTDTGKDGGKGGTDPKNEPCECIKKALNQCKKEVKKKESDSKKSGEKDTKSDKQKDKKKDKAGKQDKKDSKDKENKKEKTKENPEKSSKDEEIISEEEETSQCGEQQSQCGPQEKTKTSGKKNCKSKEFTVKCR